MVISTWWLLVVPYQNILIKPSKTTCVSATRKHLSIFFGLSVSGWKNSSRKKYSKKSCAH